MNGPERAQDGPDERRARITLSSLNSEEEEKNNNNNKGPNIRKQNNDLTT